MHNPESVLENETQIILWNYEIQTGDLDLEIQNRLKRTYRIVDFAVSTDPRVKLKESKKKDMYLYLVRELKQSMGHEGDGYCNCN